jgi:MFS family permease
MILARAIAGIGGGGLTSVASTITSDLVPITHRGIFQGYANILFGLGSG